MKQSEQEKGLSFEEVKRLQKEFGKNLFIPEHKQNSFIKLVKTFMQPMFLLLLVVSVIYFFLGELRDGIIMLVFVFVMIFIDFLQEWKTDRTLNALKDLSNPHCQVIREGKENLIDSRDLVPGDLLLIEEGMKIPADGTLIRANDLSVDESSLTGEAQAVWKNIDEKQQEKDYWKKNNCYAGTLVLQGSGLIRVEKIGSSTEYGKIGKNILEAPDRPTPLEQQINTLVKVCVILAFILLFLVFLFTFLELHFLPFKERFIQSILSGITLAMAMIPEEFPVVLTVFLSMGAWRLAKKNSLVHHLSSVETLGEISVLCVDKTGTITKNEMTVKQIWEMGKQKDLVETMGLACEVEAYDPMEKAILSFCEKQKIKKEMLFQGDLIKEYGFTNQTKMMGHVWKRKGKIVIAVKGSPEKVLSLCNLNLSQKKKVEKNVLKMSKQGLRVLAVAKQNIEQKEKIPEEIHACKLELCGLIGLQDPPRDGIKTQIHRCLKAGIRVVMLTGDNGITASSIAKSVGIANRNLIITGEELETMTEEQLCQKIEKVNIFSRVIPEHKMRIVKAFQQKGEIVAMTGDGVNDASALKYADIGIAMGKRGAEVSKQAADLILLDDNFSTILDTISDGRRIYDNIKKAISYLFSIHIPIALTSLLSPMLAIEPSSAMLLPVHIVLLELMIDPTCSIVLERQPAENNIMERKPREPEEKLLTKNLIKKGIVQGIAIFLVSFGMYVMLLPQNLDKARTMGLLILILSNLFLVQVNSSNRDSIFKTMKKLVKDGVMWMITLITIVLTLVITYTPLNQILKLQALSIIDFLIVLLLSMVATFWYEIVKIVRRKKKQKSEK